MTYLATGEPDFKAKVLIILIKSPVLPGDTYLTI